MFTRVLPGRRRRGPDRRRRGPRARGLPRDRRGARRPDLAGRRGGRHARALQPSRGRGVTCPRTEPADAAIGVQAAHRPAAPDHPVKAPAAQLAAAAGEPDHDRPGALLDRPQQRRQPVAQRAPGGRLVQPESASPSSTSTVTRSGCRRAISARSCSSLSSSPTIASRSLMSGSLLSSLKGIVNAANSLLHFADPTGGFHVLPTDSQGGT